MSTRMKTVEEVASELVGASAIYPPDVQPLIDRIADALRQCAAETWAAAARIADEADSHTSGQRLAYVFEKRAVACREGKK